MNNIKYNPDKHHRRSIRLKDYDYSNAGAYFVTICAQNMECFFGEIRNGDMELNPYGSIVKNCWKDLINHYSYVELDALTIMPNHIHGIITIPAPTRTQKNHGLSEIVRALKTFSSRKINKLRNRKGVSIWQRNYYEHIIRNEKEMNKIREYIINNPLQWDLDKENPENIEEL
jgi:REP element-mobilizing transposase RayT